MPGGGKSFFLVYRGMKAMKEGRPVFSNFPMKGAYQIKLKDLSTYVFPAGALVLIDEAGRWFNANEWKSLPSEVFDTFTLHRHLQIDMMLAMNAFGYVDINIRRVAELTYWAENKRWSPFFHYKGYYDMEKAGMNREHDVVYNIFKWSRSRKYYDTYAMSSAFKNRPLMPMIKHGPKPFTIFEVVKRYCRMKLQLWRLKKKITKIKRYLLGKRNELE